MRNFFKLFRKEPLWDFQGGIHPPEMKTQSNGTPLRQLPLPARFIVPVKQHIGHEGELLVRPGDKVLRGQPLTFGRGRMLPVHAPTSGTVDAIAPHMTAHPSGLSETCIFITPDGEDRWVEKQPLPAYQQAERATLVELIHQAGVAGLGGAGFPTATKLKGGLRGVKTLIINAAECEPYITADDRLMQDCAEEIIEGSRILAWVLQSERVMIGIEDNKPEAIAALKKALGGATDIQVRVIPTKYPSGGAKQLTKILTGLEVPHGGRSTDIGVLMQNVGTAYAVKRAIIDGEALTERVVTLTGESVKRPGNVWGRIGTPISHLLHQADFTPTAGQMVVMGGPLMGFTLPTLDVPVVKITNCILAPSASEMGDSEEEKSCIRCSACADACPAALLPQQLYWYSRGSDHDKAREHNIADCIECGACAYVCPSNIPLVQYYRQEKAEIRAIDLEAERTAQAKARFEARQARLEREKLAREARHQQAKRTVNQIEGGEVTAALARVKAKKQAENAQAAAPGEVEDASLIAQREARKAAARAQTAEKRAETEPATRQTVDPRKAAVQAAIARAKAKKTATDIPHSPELAVSAETAVAAEINAEAVLPAEASAPVDPRKAAVEAAIARAKAKKAAAAGNGAARSEAERTEAPDEAAPAEAAEATEPADPRKAAVEAAIARAKAKKAAAAGNGAARSEAERTEAPDEAAPAEAAEATEPADPRKAAVEAAIARAKAKKAAAAGNDEARSEAERTETLDEAAPAEAAEATEPADPRKAAVEAAIARVKAKKAAAAGNGAARHEPATENNDAAVAQNVEAQHNVATGSESGVPARPSAVTQDGTSDSDDPRKAAVAAAIARVKARRAQHSTQED